MSMKKMNERKLYITPLSNGNVLKQKNSATTGIVINKNVRFLSFIFFMLISPLPIYCVSVLLHISAPSV